MRIGGIDDLASENEFYGVAETGDVRQVLGTAISLPDVPVSADDAKSCVFLSDSDVYPAGPFESASIGNPVDRSDSGFLTLLGLNLHFNALSTFLCNRSRVCELLLERGPGKQEVESSVGMIGKGATRSGDLRRPGAMNESKSQVATSSQKLRGVTSADARTIFSKYHITHIMQVVFNGPMPSHQG